MVDPPEQDESPADRPGFRLPRVGWLHTFQATSTRRALLLTALGGLLIAGLVTALPAVGGGP
ncbi:MAG: septum formation family protein, partial [Mycobacterium sp.]